MTQDIFAHPLWERAHNTLLFLGVAILAIVLVRPEALPLPPEPSSRIAFAGIAALLAWISLNDFKTRLMPNTITYPLMLIGLVRAIAFRDGIFLLYWAVLFALWMVRFMGGGDAKLLMGLFGLYPDFQLVWIVAASRSRIPRLSVGKPPVTAAL